MEMGEFDNGKDIIPLPDFSELPKSGSIWGEFDILNSKESSQVTFRRVKGLVEETGLENGIYIALRQVYSAEEYRAPIEVFDCDPNKLDLEMDDWVTYSCGPLRYGEALASGYILETATITRDIIDENIPVEDEISDIVFEEIAEKIGGRKRFVPLGLSTIYDYIVRMVQYRNVRHDFEKMDMSEDSEEDLACIVGLGVVPLAKAFREDGYRIGEKFQQTIDSVYVGNSSLFTPFSGAFGGHPKAREDWQMLGLGLYTGVRLFRVIENSLINFKQVNQIES